jgi:DNA-binding MarR family transcriptional regulator
MNRAERLSIVVDETRRLFHRLANAADRAHSDLGLTASQRAVLEALSRDGPQTVPQIARAKGVSRQHIQTIANALAEAGLIAARDNPAHRRSPLLTLSLDGERCFQRVQAREQAILAQLAQRFRLADLETTAHTLQAASQLLEQIHVEPAEGE